MKYAKHIQEYIEQEAQEEYPHTYRAKILWGQEIVLKETLGGRPISKLVVGDWKEATEIAKILNKNAKNDTTKKLRKKLT